MPTISQIDRSFVAAKYAEGRAAEFGMSAEAFAEIVSSVVAKYAATATESDALLKSLRYEDLVLARACAAGNERAWNEFMARFRVRLYDTARAITRDDARGCELADGIYAELYGMDLREGARRSKLEHYSGRGSLEGWLRTVLAQEWVNKYRKVRRETSLEEQEETGAQFAAPTAPAASTNHSALAAATDAALAELGAEERYILASYHLDGRKLAEIAKTLGVHESTVSRKVEKIAKEIRSGILKHLQRQGLSRRQAEEALEVDVRDVVIDVRARLAQAAPENLSRSSLQAETPRAFSKSNKETSS